MAARKHLFITPQELAEERQKVMDNRVREAIFEIEANLAHGNDIHFVTNQPRYVIEKVKAAAEGAGWVVEEHQDSTPSRWLTFKSATATK